MKPEDRSVVGQCARQHRKLKQARAAMRRLIYCTCRSVNFERLRLRIIEVAPEAAKKVAEELVELRDRAQAERNEYQTRAWQAENFLRTHKGWIEDMLKIRFGRRADELDELARICARPAHAEIGGAS